MQTICATIYLLREKIYMSKKKLIQESKVHPVLADFFGYAYSKTALIYKLKFVEDLKDIGIIGPQCGILYILNHSGAQSQIKLGSELGIDKATMVKFIDELEKKNFVKRTNDLVDRRIKMVDLTTHGRKYLPKITAIRNKNEEMFLSVLTPAEQQSLKSIIAKLLKAYM